MSRKVLIISPYFPPVNTADMQRVRMSLPYFREFGWEAEVVAVDPRYTDLPQDTLLLESIPAGIKVHLVKAFRKSWTSKLGFGSIAYRCYWFIRQKVNELLKDGGIDLIYFSTTQFQVCTLGAYWRKNFGVPYLIDMQDPWHSEYYKDKPKAQQPPKYRLSYLLNRYLEPKAIREAAGLISVSENYIRVLQERYPQLQNAPSATITFGAFEPDFDIAATHQGDFPYLLQEGFKNIVYIGRGGMDMYSAIRPVFEAIKEGLASEPEVFACIKLYFIGTSYAPEATVAPTILPLAQQYGLEEQVVEMPARIGYYHTLNTLQQADALFIPGSDDPQYTASKIYPYLLTHKPLLTIFNSKSSAVGIMDEFGAAHNYSYDKTGELTKKVGLFLKQVVNGKAEAPRYSAASAERYSARMMTRRQCEVFNEVILNPS